MPAPAILIPQTWGQKAALTDRAVAEGRSSAWRIGILPPNGYGIRDGLLAHWRLDENTGATAYDSSSYAKHITTFGAGAAWGAAGISGPCLDFDGTVNGYVASPNITIGTSWTFALWICPDDVTTAQRFLGGAAAGRPFLRIGEAGVGKLGLGWNDSGPTFRSIDSASAVLAVGVWAHVVATHDNATNATRLYCNGVLVASSDAFDSFNYAAQAMVLGKYAIADAAFPYNGKMDEVYILDRALTQDEARALYYSPDGYVDYASMLVNNQVQISARGSVLMPAEAAQATFALRNNQQIFMEGDLANAGVRIRQAIQNVTDLMDYGDCEHATQGPMMLGDTGSNDTATATLDRDTTDFYRGASSYRFTKLTASGVYAAAVLRSTTTGMHGCVPGGQLTMSCRLKIPISQTANWTGDVIHLTFGEYYGGAWNYRRVTYTGTASEGAWRTITLTFTLNSGTSATTMMLENSPGTAPINSYLLVDDFSYSCSVPYDTTIPVRQWLQVFTGYVSPEGCQRTKGSLTEDQVTLQCFDPASRRGMKKRCKNQAVLNYKICDPADTAHSLLHLLATQMGLGTADLDVDTISAVKDYIGFNRSQHIWSLLQNLALAHGALLAFAYDGKLRLKTWTAADWAAATPEHIFDSTNIRRGWTGKSSPVACNDARMEFSQYQALPAGSIIYKNYDQWDQALGRNAITLHAGEYWPVPADSLAVAQLNYQYGQERYPIGISIINPTIGLVDSGSDIEATGAITLVSFNGSTGATEQNVDSSEIILRNNTAGDVTITKMELRGTPIRQIRNNKIETVTASDGTTPDDEDIVEQTIPGEFATDVAQAKQTCLRWVDFGHLPRMVYEFDADFTPQLQIGAICEFHPDATTDVIGVVVGYQHSTSGPWSVLSKTHVMMVERVNWNATGSGKVRAWWTATPPADVDPKRSTVLRVGLSGAAGQIDYIAPAAASQTTIQAAIDKVTSLGGGKVQVVGPGTFATTAAIELASNVTLEILSGVTIKRNCDDYAIKCIGTSGSHKSNVAIIGGGTITQDAADTNSKPLIDCYYVDGVAIRDVTLQSYYAGAVVETCTNVKIEKVSCESCAAAAVDNSVGLRVASTAGAVRIANCRVQHAGFIEIGIYASATSGECTIIGCNVEGTNTEATSIEQIGIACVVPNAVVQSNTVRNLRSSVAAGYALGIEVQGTGSKVIGNTVSGITDSGDPGWGQGIRTETGDGVTIQDNTVFDCSGHGIRVVDGSNHLVEHNRVYDCGDLMDRGDCESATAPMVTGETVPLTSNATFARSDVEAYEGTYSYKITKTVAAGTAGIVNLVDNNTDTDMHGLLPGVRYKFQCRVFIPSGGMTGSECVLYIGDSTGSGVWVEVTEAAAATYDAWQTVEQEYTMRTTATGARFRFVLATTAENNEYAYVDDIRLIPQGATDAHDVNIDDQGTDTVIQGNSTMNPNASEPNLGEFHPLNRVMSDYDVAAVNTQDSSPGTFDLRAIGVPDGATAVQVSLRAYVATASATGAFYSSVWDYDLGAFSLYPVVATGVICYQSGVPASASSMTRGSWTEGIVVLSGTSLKLYYGLSTASRLMSFAVKGYYKR